MIYGAVPRIQRSIGWVQMQDIFGCRCMQHFRGCCKLYIVRFIIYRCVLIGSLHFTRQNARVARCLQPGRGGAATMHQGKCLRTAMGGKCAHGHCGFMMQHDATYVYICDMYNIFIILYVCVCATMFHAALS